MTRPIRCKHFTGIGEDACRAGVNYRSLVGGSDFGWALRIPCTTTKRSENQVPCEKHDRMTAEEIAAEDEKFERAFQRTTGAYSAIKAIVGDRRGVSGTIDCPGCHAPLHYSVARLNGHIHACCETDECVSFME